MDLSNNEKLECATVEGTGSGHVIRVGGIGEQWSNAGSEVTISYGHPTISALHGEGAQLASPAGGEEIVVSGSNFGRNAPVTVSCNDAIDGRWYT